MLRMRKWSAAFGLLATIAASMLSAQGPSTVLVRVETTAGNIDIAVDTVHAPITSANFLRYIAGGLYDGGEFYRAARPDTYHAVLPNRPPMELIEARIPAGKQAYPAIPLERTSVTGLHHVAGGAHVALRIRLDDLDGLVVEARGGARLGRGQLSSAHSGAEFHASA